MINGEELRSTKDQSSFWLDKYDETCSDNYLATSIIKIQNGKIIFDYCSIARRPLFNGL